MPSKDEHLEQAAKNERLANILLGGDEYADWGIIALSHSALHYVEAALAILEVHSEDDGDRTVNIARYLKYVNSDYGILWNLNQNIRYFLDPVGPTEIEEAQRNFSVIKNVIKKRLQEHAQI